MSHWLERSELLIGAEKLSKLAQSHVMIVGLGGIGSFAGEFIARAGVGSITLIDGDVFDTTNKNRQLTALDSTVGRNKAVVLAERIRDINPNVTLNVVEEFVVPERVWELLNTYQPDYVMDCIDSVSPKLAWLLCCKKQKIKVITHLGAGGKSDPSTVKVVNLVDTHNCKLGSHIKKRIKRQGASLRGIKAVFSSELQDKHALRMTDGTKFKKSFYGTISYMPALFGLHGAAEVIRYLSRKNENISDEL
jgi:tRNA A37 threonylcarbamoyladenosine dehydratase